MSWHEYLCTLNKIKQNNHKIWLWQLMITIFNHQIRNMLCWNVNAKKNESPFSFAYSDHQPCISYSTTTAIKKKSKKKNIAAMHILTNQPIYLMNWASVFLFFFWKTHRDQSHDGGFREFLLFKHVFNENKK